MEVAVKASLHSSCLTRLRNTASAGAAQWKMWLIRVFLVMYSTAVCGAQNVQNVTSTPFSLTSFEPTSMEASTVSEPPVASLLLQSSWLDVFPSEKVELRCNISGSSDWKIVWQKDEQELDTGPNLSFSADRSILTITAAAKTSGVYFCKGQHKTSSARTLPSSQLKVTVYENKPKATLSRSPNFNKMFPGELINFTCLVDVASGWEYQWYKNDSQIQTSDTYTLDLIDHSNSGIYFCKAKRGKGQFYTEQSDSTSVQVSDPPTPYLKLLTPWLDVFKDEPVDFLCEVGEVDSDWTYSWYKNVDKIEDLDKDEMYHNFTSVNQTNQGDYACRAHLVGRPVNSGISNTATVKVYENTPEPTLSKSPDFTPMYVGETVNFTCTVNVSTHWIYQWYENGRNIPSATGKTFTVPLSLSNGGNYLCKATRGETTSTSQSPEIQLAVHEIPVPQLENMTQWLDLFPTESVKLSCGMQHGSGWTYTWYKAGEKVKAGDAVSFEPDGSTLTISSASAKHEGPYQCKGHLQDRSVSSDTASELTLTVYAKKPTVVLTQDPEYKVMFPGESVSFSCHINVSSGWEFFYYNNHNQLSHSGIKYSINSTGPSDGGSYTCQVKRGRNQVFSSNPSQAILLDVKEEHPKPVMTQEPKADKLYVGESVSLDCKVEISSGWEYLWSKDRVALPHKSPTFRIHDANSSVSGDYECTAKREKSTYHTQHSDRRSLQISEIPVPKLKQMTQWKDVFPSESVRLGCGMEEGISDWTYTWYKDDQKVQADDTVSFDSDARTLSIRSTAAKHAGGYSCSGKLKSRPVNSTNSSGLPLKVYDTKPRVTLMQEPEFHVMHTSDSVSFSCHINVSSGWEYLWYKDGTPLPLKSGHNYNISSVVTKDTGSYTCQVKRGVDEILQSKQSQAVKLDILERPRPTIHLMTDWSEVFATDSLMLRCEVQASNDKWNYTWFKEGIQIDQPTSDRHFVTPKNDPKQSLYTCQGNRTGQPSYSKFSDSFKTKNLLLKRRVLLSVSGCLFFGLIAVLLGCIVLRFIRKPADDDDKPEEENLFLTMAQLKDRSDAPDPMVEYLTDEGLNALPKEAEENGTLPITTEEGQALTTESDDTEENKGGMVSFKQ
ncbi:hemicentin-2-like isoform X2 [Limanda limanda]|uniref:hemicentin-2-like isoform X2 n=1 Tax=Limanda limanda TaxID=27771 RepID=UPI0029C6DC02|nr:hemicentin-2-like isoform X2 [Limanda limanda]